MKLRLQFEDVDTYKKHIPHCEASLGKKINTEYTKSNMNSKQDVTINRKFVYLLDYSVALRSQRFTKALEDISIKCLFATA